MFQPSKGVIMNKKNKASQVPNNPKEKGGRDDPSSLPGWPGHRTRNGRSGYDPIDTRTEAGHTASTFVGDLFTGQLRIRNPILLLLAGVLGLALIIPFVLAIAEMLNGNLFSLNAWLTLLIAGIIGAALFVNFIRNLIRGKK